jgi:hypothetical protein
VISHSPFSGIRFLYVTKYESDAGVLDEFVHIFSNASLLIIIMIIIGMYGHEIRSYSQKSWKQNWTQRKNSSWNDIVSTQDLHTGTVRYLFLSLITPSMFSINYIQAYHLL